MNALVAQARLRGQDSQRAFDAFMRSAAEPGTIHQLPPAILDDRIPVTSWLPLTLADVDINVSVDDDTNSLSAALVRMATGARVVSLEQAAIVAIDHIEPHHLERLRTGDALHPEAGAKLAIRVLELHAGQGEGSLTAELRGPGIPDERMLGVDGLHVEVLSRIGRASGPFPAGFDTWLITDSGAMAAIPRSTTISVSSTIRSDRRKVA